MANTTKIDEERAVLAVAIPLLKQLYGELCTDPAQTDRPDAALVLENDRRVAVEITSLDRADDKQYWNDKTHGAEAVDAQLTRMVSGDPLIDRPIKSMKVDLTRDYLAGQALSKAAKHDAYMAAGIYAESVLITTSEYITARHAGFEDYYIPMASYLFHAAKFPFNKVIFACKKTNKAILVYDKSATPTPEPSDTIFPNQHEEVSRIMGAIGQTMHLFGKPLVPKEKRKSRSNKDRKR
ncbi:hypothetical protein WJ63_01570 [Burkholderia pyrrocinia]|nr:hypothetical protein WJ63_01570 [Burkholderia pyrrocinia]